ncbi:hypothetical protein N9K77_01700, partial [bacterium]|nr:hypothetical protein [bacterium]
MIFTEFSDLVVYPNPRLLSSRHSFFSKPTLTFTLLGEISSKGYLINNLPECFKIEKRGYLRTC